MRLYNQKRPGFIKMFIERHMKTRPVVDIGTCRGCAGCKGVCPTKALDLYPFIPQVELRPKTGDPRPRPEIELHKCTRCYRCKELCPHKAITTYKPRLMKILRL